MTVELFFTKPVSGAFTGSVLGDRGSAVSFFGSASFAPKAGDALTALQADNADTADFATTAGSAATAGSADTATSASHAVQADSASFAPTASAALTAVSASHALQADNAQTAVSASHALQADNAQTADTASLAQVLQGDVSASQVLIGSFQTGTYVFPGNIVVDGTASITHLLVTTTSVIQSSGSTIFGDTLDDTHQFTGSTSVTGAFSVDGPATFNDDVTINAQLIVTGITASLLGTASFAVSASHAVNADTAAFAVNVESASFATTASFAQDALSASFATTASFAETASFVLDSETASFAVTASFAQKAAVAPMNINLNNFFGAEMKLQVPVAVTEQDDGQRTAASLLGYVQARIIVRVTQAPTGSTIPPEDDIGVIAVEGSLDDSAFVFLCGGSAAAGSGAPSASLSGTIDQALTVVSPWCDITGTLAVEDVFLRWVTYSGSNLAGNFRPRVGSINLQVR